MKRYICLFWAVLCLTVSASAQTEERGAAQQNAWSGAEWGVPEDVRGAGWGVPEDVRDAAPESAAEYLDGIDPYTPGSFAVGAGNILNRVRRQAGDVIRQRMRGAAAVLLSAILCGAVRSGCGDNESTSLCVTMTGALSVTALTAGSLEQLIGLGWRTIEELDTFSKAFLPTLAAAVAASGAVTTATFQQVTTVLLAKTLLSLMNKLLIPLTYLYIGLLTASCTLPGNALEALADGLKRLITALLTGTVLLFTVYLSVSHVIAGSADGMAVRAVRTAVTNAVPVVGGILAQVSESILAGAGMLKNSLGVFGMLTVLGACAYPFLQLGAQYLLYKAAATLTAVTGMSELGRLIDGLGGAFGLVLGMTASAALLLFVSALSFLSAAAL